MESPLNIYRYSHPSLIYHLRKLFNLIMQHGYVPKNFGDGVVVPILKDRLGDVSSLRAITISEKPGYQPVVEL